MKTSQKTKIFDIPRFHKSCKQKLLTMFLFYLSVFVNAKAFLNLREALNFQLKTVCVKCNATKNSLR